MDGTILRRLRELREEESESCNYHVIDSERSIYEKQITEKQNGQIQFQHKAEPCLQH
jgi:hypothetical protein